MEQRLYEALQSNPIIAAVRDDEGLEACLQADVQTVFVLYGDICGIAGIVRRNGTILIPGGNDAICEGDDVIVVTQDAALQDIHDILSQV